MISQHFVTQLSNDMLVDQKKKYDDIIIRFEENMEKLRGFIQISDVSFPESLALS
jgi:hypothetical protein